MTRTKRTINCQECDASYETYNTNTKRCRICQMIAQLTFVGTRTRECIYKDEGEHRFVPVTNNKDMTTCGEHDIQSRTSDALGVCGICHQDSDKLWHEDIHICRPCITKPENRIALLNALKLKATRRKREHAGQAV